MNKKRDSFLKVIRKRCFAYRLIDLSKMMISLKPVTTHACLQCHSADVLVGAQDGDSESKEFSQTHIYYSESVRILLCLYRGDKHILPCNVIRDTHIDQAREYQRYSESLSR